MGKMINSVRGPIDIDSLGVTLTHEHLWFDVATLYKRAHPDLVMTDEKVTKKDLERQGADHERQTHENAP